MADAIISNLKKAAKEGDTNSVDCILDDITEAMKYAYALAGRTDQPRAKSLLQEQFNPDTFEDSKVGAAIDSQHDMDSKGLISVIINDVVPFLENAMQSPERLADIMWNVRSVIPGRKMLDYILHEMVFLTLKCAVKTKDMGLLEDNLANMDMVVTRLVGIDLKWLTSILSSLHAVKAKDTESLKPILYDMTIPGLLYHMEARNLKKCKYILKKTRMGVHGAYLFAASWGHMNCMLSMAKKFAMDDLVIINNEAALPLAIEDNHSNIVQFLLGRNDRETLWFWAARSKFPAVLELLLDEETYPDLSKEDLSAIVLKTCQENGKQFSALQYAALSDDDETVSFLLERDEFKVGYLYEGLKDAVDKSCEDVISVFLSSERVSENESSLLEIAKKAGDEKIIDLFECRRRKRRRVGGRPQLSSIMGLEA